MRSKLATESRFLKRVTEDEPQLIDPNPEPRDLTDGEGELVFKILWSYVENIVDCAIDIALMQALRALFIEQSSHEHPPHKVVDVSILGYLEGTHGLSLFAFSLHTHLPSRLCTSWVIAGSQRNHRSKSPM